MTAHSDHEAFLRAALHAAADSLEPRGDGLERIRARVQRPRPVFVTRAQAIGNEALLRTPAWLQDAAVRIASVFEYAWKRLSPPPAPGRHRSRAQGWLRPIAAMAVLMFVVAAVTYVAIDASTAVSPSSSHSHSNGGQTHNSHHSSGPPAPSHPAGTTTPAGRRSSSPHKTTRATPTPTPKTSAPPSAAPSVSVTSSPAPSGSTPSSPAPTPTVTGASSGAAGTAALSG